MVIGGQNRGNLKTVMAKIRQIFDTSLTLNFQSRQDELSSYWEGFLKTELGKVYLGIPWDELVSAFGLKVHKVGAKPIFSPRGKIALMILKAYSNGCSDQQLIEQLSGNIHYQLFCGVFIPAEKPLTNGKLVSDIRCSLAARLKVDDIQAVLAAYWKPYLRQSDGVLMDATCYESSVRYPTNQKLLWEAVQWSYAQVCSHCKVLGIRRPRTKYKKWQARYAAYSRLRRRPASRKRSITGGLLRLLAKLDRELDSLELQELGLPEAYYTKREVIKEVYIQQYGLFYEDKKPQGRIVSLAKPYLRPIVRGKETKLVEFGAKVHKFQVDGLNFIEHLDFNAFHEGIRFKKTVRKAKSFFGKIRYAGADAIYGTNENRNWCRKNHIRTDFRRKGRAGKFEDQRKLLAKTITRERASRMEGSFGNEKNRYGLHRIRARTQLTEILWIFFGIHTPNALEVGRRISQQVALQKAA